MCVYFHIPNLEDLKCINNPIIWGHCNKISCEEINQPLIYMLNSFHISFTSLLGKGSKVFLRRICLLQLLPLLLSLEAEMELHPRAKCCTQMSQSQPSKNATASLGLPSSLPGWARKTMRVPFLELFCQPGGVIGTKSPPNHD